MAKRRAEKQISKDDVDIDDEVEESGSFQQASEEVVANRIIKRAKRRVVGEESSPSPLANFSGFSKAPSGSPFSYFNKISQNSTNDCAPKTYESKNKDVSSQQQFDHKKKQSGLESLKDLNLSCSRWIQKHLDENPYVVLVPVFQDYEKHLMSLNLAPDPAASSNSATSSVSATSTPIISTLRSSTEGSVPETASPSFLASSSSPLAFKKLPDFSAPKKTEGEKNKTVSSTDTSSSNIFKFGNVSSSPLNNGTTNNAASVNSPVFHIGASIESPAFGFIKPPTEGIDGGNAADPEDEPPQFDFVPVGEDGSVFDIRCKVFLKKNSTYSSIGVGTLFLKPVSGEKTQLIVRADTAQGSVLLNLILTPDLPLQSTGKNNIILVCIPTPESKPPPVPVLIRVKNSEERDKLMKEMERLRAS